MQSGQTSTISATAYQYSCGACGQMNRIPPKEAVRCSNCGHRVLYKPRSTRVTQVEAR